MEYGMDRGARLRHPRVDSRIPPSRISHLVSNIVVDTSKGDPDALSVGARFRMLECRPGYEQRVFGGRYDYQLLRAGLADLRISAKKATILNFDAVHLPIALPF